MPVMGVRKSVTYSLGLTYLMETTFFSVYFGMLHPFRNSWEVKANRIPYNHNDPGGDCDLEECGGYANVYALYIYKQWCAEKKT